jgi:hypothetical protein
MGGSLDVYRKKKGNGLEHYNGLGTLESSSYDIAEIYWLGDKHQSPTNCMNNIAEILLKLELNTNHPPTA